MSRSDSEPTWWAPTHLQPVYCCCRHPHPVECYRIRMQYLGGSIFDYVEDRCECCCHDDELDEDE